MRRTLVMLLLLLAGGAIVNVAVAWGCAKFVEFQQGGSVGGPRGLASRVETNALRRNNFVTSGSGASLGETVEAWTETAVGRQWTYYYRGSFQGVTLGDIFAIRIASGWPCLAFAGLTGQVARPANNVWQTREVGAWRANPNRVQTWPLDVVALVPLWPGFAVNTLLYAVILWGVFAVPFALRLRRRIKHGLCPKCAYDLRGTGSPVCPECGAAALVVP